MAFPPAFLDELRFRVRLTDVIGRKVKLSRAGREWKGCCPFHNEKTPSFYINEDKGFYHCFGCGAHGDVIRFLTEAEGMGFLEAVQNLAAQAGLEVPRETPEDKEKAERVKGLHDVMELAASWFTENLNGMAGSAARSYFERRGLSRATIEKFRLGFAPDSKTALRTALIAKGATEQQLVDAGLLIQVEDKQPYDRFRGRVMFPIRDPKGRVIAFGGRVLDGGEPKYLNSPDTPLFDKGRTLFNFDIAGPLARKAAEIYVVEGYMDVIALAQAGIENAVAPLGTALTEDQIKYLWRVAPEPLLCFDGDSAGQRAALRGALRALPLLEPGKSLRFITLPEKEDPDSLVRAKGRAAFDALKGKARSLVNVIWSAEIQVADMKTPENRALFERRLFEICNQILDKNIARLYRTEFQFRIREAFGFTNKRNERNYHFRRGVIPPTEALIRTNKRWTDSNQKEPTIRSLILCVIRHPSLLAGSIEFFMHIPVDNDSMRDIRDKVSDIFVFLENQTHGAVTHVDMLKELDHLGYYPAILEMESSDKLNLRFSRADAHIDDAMEVYSILGSWHTYKGFVDEDILSARKAAADDMTEERFSHHQYLVKEMAELSERMNALIFKEYRNGSGRLDS